MMAPAFTMIRGRPARRLQQTLLKRSLAAIRWTRDWPDQGVSMFVEPVGGYQVDMFGVAPWHFEVIVRVDGLHEIPVAEYFENLY